MAVFVKIVAVSTTVDFRCRCETPAGVAGQVRPRRRRAPRRLTARPAESECLQRKSTNYIKFAIKFKSNKVYENSQKYKGYRIILLIRTLYILFYYSAASYCEGSTKAVYIKYITIPIAVVINDHPSVSCSITK
jgi:hypothetical protein